MKTSCRTKLSPFTDGLCNCGLDSQTQICTRLKPRALNGYSERVKHSRETVMMLREDKLLKHDKLFKAGFLLSRADCGGADTDGDGLLRL